MDKGAFRNGVKLIDKINYWFNSESILVLSPGKCGSSTILESLSFAGISCYQSHTLNSYPQGVYFVNINRKYLFEAIYKVKIFLAILWFKLAGKKIIIAVRDPKIRNVSAFFEQCWKIGIDLSSCTCGQLVSAYKKGKSTEDTKWYARNLGDALKVLPADICFDGKKSAKVKKGKINILLLRLEDSDCWEDELSQFIGKRISLKKRNISSKKKYSHIFNECSDNLVNYCNYTYSKDEYLRVIYKEQL